MGGHSVPAAPGFETEAQASAIERARECAELIEPPTESLQAALSALLKATAGYGSVEGVGDVATFVAGAVSLPEDVRGSPGIHDIAPESASIYLEEFDSMLRPLSEVLEMDDRLGKVLPYMDPKLGGSEQLYARFVNDLDSRGLLCFSQSPKVQCSCFFVRKKPSASGAFLRMIVDCRPANRVFGEPPNSVLASPESMARMELEESDTLYVSTIDVRDCFYRIRIPQQFA